MINGYFSVADPDLQITEGGGGGGGGGVRWSGHRDPEIRWEPDLKEIYFGLPGLTLV